MQTPIPLDFRENLSIFTKTILKDGFELIDPQQYLKTRTFSVLLQFNQDINKKLETILQSNVPSNILDKLYLQPYTGFHITLQSTQVPSENIGNIVCDLNHYLQTIKPFQVNIVGPYSSHRNLFFAVTSKENITDIRNSIQNIFNGYGLESNLPVNNGLMWVSVSRFTQQLSEKERNFLIYEIEQEFLKNIDIKHIFITKNDPVFSNSSEILEDITKS